jgi:hypothetical protein
MPARFINSRLSSIALPPKLFPFESVITELIQQMSHRRVPSQLMLSQCAYDVALQHDSRKPRPRRAAGASELNELRLDQ